MCIGEEVESEYWMFSVFFLRKYAFHLWRLAMMMDCFRYIRSKESIAMHQYTIQSLSENTFQIQRREKGLMGRVEENLHMLFGSDSCFG